MNIGRRSAAAAVVLRKGPPDRRIHRIRWMTPMSVSPSSPLSSGPEAAGYVVHEFLGRGSSGMVWRATQEGTLRVVALKFLAPWQSHGLAAVRFAREAEIAASLEHANIARVFGSGESASGPWLAMELVDGPPVDRWVAEASPALRERVILFQKICAAVRHAHQHGVIHRDLKPGNVLVGAEGEPKVVDFGLACWQSGPSLDVTLTRQGDIFGSLGWMPPEQASGRWAEVDALSDVYSLGALLYSLLAGGPPLDLALPPAALLAAAQSGERKPLRTAGAKVPRDLELIVEKCLAVEKARRYQSAAGLEEDVNRWLAGDPVRARKAAPLYWLRKKVRRHWVAATAGAALVLAAGGLGWGYWQAQQNFAAEKRRALEREAEQSTRLLHEAQDLVTQLLVELRPKLEEAGHPEWVEEAVRRVAAFPWDIGGQGHVYDPRRFRALAASVTGEMLGQKGQWGGSLKAWHEAIEILKTLVPEHPDNPVFREELGRARLGEETALLKLGFHKEAVAAGQKALEAFTPPPGQQVPAATLERLVDTTTVLVEAALLTTGKTDDALAVVNSLAGLLPAVADPGLMSQVEAEWHARIGRDAARLTAIHLSPAEAEILAVRAVACARQAARLSGDGALTVRTLVEALATEADVARLLGDDVRMLNRLTEAGGLLGGNKAKAPLSLSAQPFREVALGWERYGSWMVEQGRLEPAIHGNDQAINLWGKIRRRNKSDIGALRSAGRILLVNATLWRRLDRPEEAARCASSAASRLELCVEGVRSDKMTARLDHAEALVFLAEVNAPRPEGMESWVDRAAAALRPAREKASVLREPVKQRLAALEQRLAAVPGP